MAPNKSLFLPTQPMSEHMKQIDMLKGKVGGAFDKVYMNHMVMDHQEDVSEFQKASTSVKDVDLKALIPQPACLENAFRLCKSHF